MVAALDTYIYFVSKPAFDRWAKHVQERSKGGGGRIVAALLGDEITTGVDAARSGVGGAPLGVVTETETQAIEAIATGADEATVLTDEDEAQLTAFLDRVKVRAQLRMEGKRQQQDLVQAERLTALGTLVAGVAHEMNNPLSTITLGFDVLRTNLLRDLQSLWLLKDDASDDSRQAAAIAALEFSPREAASLLGDLDAATASRSEELRS
jgi:signal transduction histidine kinase